jgi:penicillin-binding protein 2
MANALGYIGEISKAKMELVGKDNYTSGDYIGISGIEEKYEKELRGQRGVKYVMVNVKGIEKGSFMGGEFDTVSVAGKDLTSTIDIDLQMYAEKLMLNQIGSVVAIEPSTGEILCFVSSPNYDPNLLTGKDFAKNFRNLLVDPQKPLFNRPLMAIYPPGSTFKPINTMIALSQQVIDSTNVYPCNRGLVKCHGGHTSTNMHSGIQYSCNPYAYNIFKRLMYRGKSSNMYIDTRLGYEIWRKEVLKFGFAKKLGVDLPNEKNGNIPSVKYYNRYFGENRWAFETIYSLALGQGEIGLTPIQMANEACIFANRGYFYTPHIIKAIGEDRRIRSEFVVKHDLGYPKPYWNSMASAMKDVVSAGTATMARSTVLTICGKTGTVENPHGKDHSIFIGFAPLDKPVIAIAVVMENAGWGATAAAPLASLVIEKYIRKEIKRLYLEDYVTKGQFFE